MEFITAEMAKEFTSRFAGIPEIKVMMEEIYQRSLLGFHDAHFTLETLSEPERKKIKIFFVGMGFKVTTMYSTKNFQISW